MVDRRVLVAIIATYMYELSKRGHRVRRHRVISPLKINSWRIASKMDVLRGRL